MYSLIITGGVATGKSTAARQLRALVPTAASFDADAEVHALLAEPQMVASISAAFGPEVMAEDGFLNRNRLRERVFGNDEARRKLEDLLHPAVRGRAERAAAAAESDGVGLFFAEIPLFYETAVTFSSDAVLTVACAPAEQRRRLENDRGLAPALAAAILDAQWPILRKVAAADFVVWNGGSLECLKTQLLNLLKRLPRS